MPTTHPDNGAYEPTTQPAEYDAEVIRGINARYSGQFDTLDFNDPDVRRRLAWDLGVLIGLGLRLMDERNSLRDRLEDINTKLKRMLDHA